MGLDDAGRIPVPGTSVKLVHKQGWEGQSSPCSWDTQRAPCSAHAPESAVLLPEQLRLPAPRSCPRCQSPSSRQRLFGAGVELRGKAALGARARVQGKGSGAANPCPEGRSRGSKAAKCKRGFCERQHARLCKPTWAGSSLWMAKCCWH